MCPGTRGKSFLSVWGGLPLVVNTGAGVSPSLDWDKLIEAKNAEAGMLVTSDY